MTTDVLDRLDRAARELNFSLAARVDTEFYSIKDVEMRDLLEDAAKRIRNLEALDRLRHRRREHSPGFSSPVRWR